jgi:hypothetical protein
MRPEFGLAAAVRFSDVVARDQLSWSGGRRSRTSIFPILTLLRFATVAEVPSPWVYPLHDLRLAAPDPTRLARVLPPLDAREYRHAARGTGRSARAAHRQSWILRQFANQIGLAAAAGLCHALLHCCHHKLKKPRARPDR